MFQEFPFDETPTNHLEKVWDFLDYFCKTCFVIFTSLNIYLGFALMVRQNVHLASFLTPQIYDNYSDFPTFYKIPGN